MNHNINRPFSVAGDRFAFVKTFANGLSIIPNWQAVVSIVPRPCYEKRLSMPKDSLAAKLRISGSFDTYPPFPVENAKLTFPLG